MANGCRCDEYERTFEFDEAGKSEPRLAKFVGRATANSTQRQARNAADVRSQSDSLRKGHCHISRRTASLLIVAGTLHCVLPKGTSLPRLKRPSITTNRAPPCRRHRIR